MRALVSLATLAVLASVVAGLSVHKTEKSDIRSLLLKDLLELVEERLEREEDDDGSGSGEGGGAGGWEGAEWPEGVTCQMVDTKDTGYDPTVDIPGDIAQSVECGERQDDKRDELLFQLLDALSQGKSGKRHHKREKTTRIVGGEESEYGQWPWATAIGSKKVGPDCGGSLIAPQWVLTAAHCVPVGMAKPCDYNVRLGEHSLSGSEEDHVDVTPEKIIVHPDYDPDNDIALIKLPSPAPIDSHNYVNTVCLPKPGQKFGSHCYGLGWGDQKFDAGDYPDKTRHVDLPLIDQTKCKEIFKERLQPGMMCAGHLAGGKDTCQGDSGGPLVCKQADGSFVQAGVVSWGDGCADKNSPGIYSDVRFYLHWIESVMARH